MPSIKITQNYTENNISSLIAKLNFIFKLKGRLIPGYSIEIEIEKKEYFTAITTLLFYKFIAYAIDENCLKNPMTNLDEKAELFSKYNLHELMESYLRKSDIEKMYLKIKPITQREFFVAPHPISRHYIKNKTDFDSKYCNTIEAYYKSINSEIVEYIKTCLVEIASNFYSHALDKKSILMAEGNKNNVEIISVDTSEGIIATLKETFKNEKDTEILKKAFNRKVSSKLDKGHCGTGLWLVNEIVSRLKGKLIVHTGGYVYRNIQGNIRIFASSYWQGTILYMKLPITEVSEMQKFLSEISKNEKKYL